MSDEKNILVMVAHPDDETLWCGGLLLKNSQWQKTIFSFTRESDKDRNPKFYRACEYFGANGVMSDIDDGAEQKPVSYYEYQMAAEKKLEKKDYDLIITHNPSGEYTRHLRHEEVSLSVLLMVGKGILNTKEMWFFNFSDTFKKEFPRARQDSDLIIELDDEIYNRKKKIICEIYGFSESSWEAQTTPKKEGFRIMKEFFRRIK